MGQTFSTWPLLAAALGLTVSLASHADEPRTRPVADFQSCAKPAWPKEALRKEQSGTVTLSFLIAADGSVADTKLVRSSGFPLLDEAAASGMRQCRFKPGTVDGKPVSAWHQIQYVWELEGVSRIKIDQQAVKQYHDAALADDPEALYMLAKAYSNGAANQAASLEQFRTTLDKSLAAAQCELARRLENGSEASKDQVEATVWYRKAAEAGHATAQLELGYRYEHGNGVTRDCAEAMAWYLKAAAQGDHQAEINIGLLHAYGRGVAIDMAEAAKWYRKAADGDRKST